MLLVEQIFWNFHTNYFHYNHFSIHHVVVFFPIGGFFFSSSMPNGHVCMPVEPVCENARQICFFKKCSRFYNGWYHIQTQIIQHYFKIFFPMSAQMAMECWLRIKYYVAILGNQYWIREYRYWIAARLWKFHFCN